MSPLFVPFKNGFNAVPCMVLFTHNVKKIKGVAHKNVGVNGTCKRTLIPEKNTAVKIECDGFHHGKWVLIVIFTLIL